MSHDQIEPFAGLPGALAAWRRLLGEAAVDDDAAAMAAIGETTFAWSHPPLAVIRPGNHDEVRACVAIAVQCKVPVYPVSRGRNWGFGSRAPASAGCVLLDLSRLDRIVAFDPDFACITVEPGVTFHQVSEFLRDSGEPLYLATIGGPPDASLIGNALERGDGYGPLGNRADHQAGMRVVLADGRELHTGFGRIEGARCAPLHRHGVGPALEGLFFQSNLGVVTEMTFWLDRLPGYYQGFVVSLPNEGGLARTVDAVRHLMQQRVLEPNTCYFWNDYKLLARQRRYPWKATQGRTPLLPGEGLPRWFLSGSLLSANRGIGQAVRDHIEAVLGPVCPGLIFYDAKSPPPGHQGEFRPGQPSDENLVTAYWRKRAAPPATMDLDRDRCGLIWLCPALPMQGGALTELMAACERRILEAGFEPQIGVTVGSARTANGYLAIAYDRDVPGDDAKAMACYEDLMASLVAWGFPPYRLGVQSQQLQLPERGAHSEVLGAIKSLLDPADILAPGRYITRRTDAG